jgi:hypothetical protein
VHLFTREQDKYINRNDEILSAEFLDKNYGSNYIIQEYVNQHSYFQQFNRTSLNTIRVFTYRSVKTEEIIVLHSVQRIGWKNSIVDNQASGGISCGIDNNGKLNTYAIDKFGRIYQESGSGFVFSEAEDVMRIDEIKELAKKIASKNYYARLLGLDLCVDSDNNIKLIEINNKYLEINFLQMNNGPLFGEYTDEVIEYCSD